jgi:organic radical activating enzyme
MCMDYYCTDKFTDLQVHVQSRLLYNCCKAYPERVDLDWLEANPGKLFHTDTMVEDRKLMLDNKSCTSCHHGCYKYEEQGLSSKRQQSQNHSTIADPYAPLKNIQIMLSTDCNLSCVYCSPEFSTSWHKEIEKKGDYVLDGHVITNDNWSKLWSKMKQKSRGAESRFFKMLLGEIELAKEIKEISLLGGEPLLNNQLDQILDHAQGKKISITTGLGVSDKRLQNFLNMIKERDIKFLISAEATGMYFEFIRHGLSWSDFRNRVDMIAKDGHEIQFISTVSNLSAFDFHNFYRAYNGTHPISMGMLSDRPFLLPHVLDDRSKEECRKKLYPLGDQARQILDMIDNKPSETDRKNLGNYLKQLSSRRAVNLEFLPEHFRKWCGVN